MKKNYSLFVLFAGLFFVTACGSSGGSGSVLGLPQTPETTTDDNSQRSSDPSFYQLSSDLNVKALTENNTLQALVLRGGTQVTVLDKAQINGEEMIHLGLENNDDMTDIAQDVWVTASDFNLAEMSLVDDVDPYDEEGYEINPLSTAARKKMTYCYKYVKLYLLDHKLVNSYLPGGSAYMAATILPQYGFVKTSRKPSNPIVNDVCVYKGGPSGHGHIEVYTSKGWYYGYGYKAAPIKNRTFMGCFHKS